MLFIAEGQIRGAIEPGDHTVAAAWVGSMVDSGFVQAGYLDAAGPARHPGSVGARSRGSSFKVSHVRALRFS
jgi:hypothetical protein